MNITDITSIGWLNNHSSDFPICLTISLKYQNQPIYVSITKAEFDLVGGRDGLNKNKQLGVDLYNKYGAGRPD
jgi:hypothetical protein